MHTKSPWSQQELVQHLLQGKLQVPPVLLRFVPEQLQILSGVKPGGVLEVSWQERSYRFVFEYKTLNTPKAIDTAVAQVSRFATQSNFLPMIIVPFLSEERLHKLEQEKISAIDLCGNGVLIAPGMAVWRSGQPNLFKASQSIKNIYRGSSSIFARCFLLRPEFTSLLKLRAFALDRLESTWGDAPQNSKLMQSTASKVVQALEQELIVVKEQNLLRLTDAPTLLTRLRTNYQPSEGARLEGKTPLSSREVWQRLNAVRQTSFRYVTTGAGSAARYGVLSGTEKVSLYVTSCEAATDLLNVSPTRVFPNIELIEAKSDLIYFDVRKKDLEIWASPIQTWLELAAGGPRERAAANILERELLENHAETLL